MPLFSTSSMLRKGDSGLADCLVHRGGTHRNIWGDNDFHLTVRVMKYTDVSAALVTGTVDSRLVVSERYIHVSFPRLYE